jgi:AcrR family transcriptional regulator
MKEFVAPEGTLACPDGQKALDWRDWLRLKFVRMAKSSDDVLDAAARIFRRQGFAATTLREVAGEAGLLPGSVHYRFPTRDALLLALMERAVSRGIAAVRAVAQSSDDPVERMRLALRAHLRLLVESDDAYVLLYDWRALQGDARASMIRLRDQYEAFWDGLLYEAAGAARLKPGVDLKLLRLLGFGALNWAAQWYRPEGGRTPDEIADTLWASLAFGVLDSPVAPKQAARA